MIYLYALAAELGALPDVEGLDGAQLEHRAIDGLDAVFTRHDALALEPAEEAVVVHARVVDALAPRAAGLLPARFGRTFADEAALWEAVARSAETLTAQLANVRGAVELGVRVIGDERGPTPVAASGREYMEARLTEAVAQRTVADDVHEPLAALARDSTRSTGGGSRVVMSGAYLVDPADVAAFRDRVRELGEQHPELSIVCTGPWPPYSFAGGELDL